MKKLLLSMGLTLSILSQAQINLEHTYNAGKGNQGTLQLVHLSSRGYKYLFIVQNAQNTTTQINLYNLNHSVFKAITPPSFKSQVGSNIGAVSDSLFDTKTATIKYYENITDSNFVSH